MKKLILKIILFFPILFLVAGINYTMDPARIFSGEKEEDEMASLLLQGKKLIVYNPNFNHRYFQRTYIRQMKKKRDIAVAGSSRTFLINDKMFPGCTLVNSSIMAATLEDYMSLYGLYRRNKVLPSVMIIGVDPWIFNANNLFRSMLLGTNQDAYNEIKNLASSHFDLKYRLKDYVPPQLLELISFSYLNSSLMVLRGQINEGELMQRVRPQQWYETTQKDINDDFTYLPDGSRNYQKARVDIKPEQVKENVARVIASKSYSVAFMNYVMMDPVLKDEFNAFIELTKKEGVELIFYLPPFYPDFYRYLITNNTFNLLNIAEVESYLRRVAERYHIKVIGSYDPDRTAVTAADFIDQMHMRSVDSIEKIFTVKERNFIVTEVKKHN